MKQVLKLFIMKNYDIERILKPAFKLFLTYNYEAGGENGAYPPT